MRAQGGKYVVGLYRSPIVYLCLNQKTKKRLLAFTPVPVCNMYLYLLGYTIICWPRDDESRGALAIP